MGNLLEANDAPRRCHRCGRTLYGPQVCDCIRIVDPGPAPRRRGEPPPDRLGEVPDGDWSADAELASDVRGQLARWRGIREGEWVRRRVLTGESGPLAPPPEDPGRIPAPRGASEPAPTAPRREDVSEDRRAEISVRASAPASIEDTAEVRGLPLDYELSLDAPTGGGRGASLLVAVVLLVAAAGVAWAIMVLV